MLTAVGIGYTWGVRHPVNATTMVDVVRKGLHTRSTMRKIRNLCYRGTAVDAAAWMQKIRSRRGILEVDAVVRPVPACFSTVRPQMVHRSTYKPSFSYRMNSLPKSSTSFSMTPPTCRSPFTRSVLSVGTFSVVCKLVTTTLNSHEPFTKPVLVIIFARMYGTTFRNWSIRSNSTRRMQSMQPPTLRGNGKSQHNHSSNYDRKLTHNYAGILFIRTSELSVLRIKTLQLFARRLTTEAQASTTGPWVAAVQWFNFAPLVTETKLCLLAGARRS